MKLGEQEGNRTLYYSSLKLGILGLLISGRLCRNTCVPVQLGNHQPLYQKLKTYQLMVNQALMKTYL